MLNTGKVEPKNDSRAKIGSIIGKLELMWKSNLGESGRYVHPPVISDIHLSFLTHLSYVTLVTHLRLQTAPLERKVPQRVELELTVRNIPPHIYLETPFDIVCELTNASDRNMTPVLTFERDKMGGLAVNGTGVYILVMTSSRVIIDVSVTGVNMTGGVMVAGSTTQITLSLFPTKPGVQKVRIYSVVDDTFFRKF